MTNAMSLILALSISRFLDGDDPRVPSYGVYISQLIRFARMSSQLADLSSYNKTLTVKFLQQGYRYHNLGKFFFFFFQILSSPLRIGL